MLEAIDDESLDADTSEHLVVVDHDGLHRGKAFDLRQQYERVKVVVRQHKFLKFRELLQLVQILMVHNQVEPDVVQVNFFDLRIELSAL